MKITKRFTFDAAHHLPNYVGKCKQLHGHTYVLEVTITGDVDPYTGMVIDFANLKGTVNAKALAYLDHKLLNDIIENPTAENIIQWIYGKVKPHINQEVSMKLWETQDSYVEL